MCTADILTVSLLTGQRAYQSLSCASAYYWQQVRHISGKIDTSLNLTISCF